MPMSTAPITITATPKTFTHDEASASPISTVPDVTVAQSFIVIARTGGEPGDEQGLSALLVDADSQGLAVIRQPALLIRLFFAVGITSGIVSTT